MQPEPRHAVAGWVLVGGQSKRMGRDKATLPANAVGLTLAQSIAGVVGQVASPVTLLGDPVRYQHLGLPVVADVIENRGPLGGLHAALMHTRSDWNLIVACDLDGLTAGFLTAILRHAPESHVVIAAGQPLCGVYHRDCLPAVEKALRENRPRARDLAAGLNAVEFASLEHKLFNVNTISDWERSGWAFPKPQ